MSDHMDENDVPLFHVSDLGWDDTQIPLAKGNEADKGYGDPRLNEELGITSPLPMGSWSDFINATTPEISRVGLVALDDLVEMRRKDGQARALLRLLTLPIIAARRDGEGIEPDEGDAEQETDYANAMFNTPPQNGGMSTTKTKIIKNTLLGLCDGFACFEEVRQVPDKGPLKGKITLRKLAYRDSRTIRFRVDDKGGFDGFRQVTSLNGKSIDVVIPKEKAWYWACNEEENPYYGIPVFEAAYQHYDIKRKLYYIAHLAAQFSAVPGRLGMVPRSYDVNQLRQFKLALANFAFNTAMTFPEGYDVKPFQASGQFNFLSLIDHHNHMMSRSVLAGFIDNEDRPALVDIAKADPQADMFVVQLESIMNDIAESWTHYLMPKYIDWNFGTGKYPVFRFGQLSDENKDAIKEVFTAVVTSSVLNCTPEFVREMEKELADRFGFDIDYDEIEKQEEEAAKQAEEQAQQQAEMEAQQTAQGLQAGPQGPGAPGAPGGAPKPFGGPPKQFGGPPKPKALPPVAASRDADINELTQMAEELLQRHLEEDLWAIDDGEEDD